MDANVQESTAKSEKLSIDSGTPKYSTNWCDIPMEMRLECIKRMDLKARMRLRGTSKTEKLLVESAKKCYLNRLALGFSYKALTVKTPGYDWSFKIDDDSATSYQNWLKCLLYMLTHHEIDTFEINVDSYSERHLEPVIAELSNTAPFRFKTFASDGDSLILKYFLKNCEGVENILLDTGRGGNDAIEGLIDFPSMINAKLLQMVFLDDMKHPIQLVQKWIENDAEVGKKMRFALNDAKDEQIEQFASIFKDRVISKDGKQVRIRTDNDSKHIILREDISFYVDSFNEEYYTCTIIPSDLLELPKDCEWAEKIHDEEHEEDLDGDFEGGFWDRDFVDFDDYDQDDMAYIDEEVWEYFQNMD